MNKIIIAFLSKFLLLSVALATVPPVSNAALKSVGSTETNSIEFLPVTEDEASTDSVEGILPPPPPVLPEVKPSLPPLAVPTVPKVKPVKTAHVISVRQGKSSWYGVGDGYHGQQAADGSIFNAYSYSIASWHYPLGAVLRVTCLDTGKTIEATVTDRGGYHLLDVSYQMAFDLGCDRQGIFPVKVERVK